MRAKYTLETPWSIVEDIKQDSKRIIKLLHLLCKGIKINLQYIATAPALQLSSKIHWNLLTDSESVFLFLKYRTIFQ